MLRTWHLFLLPRTLHQCVVIISFRIFLLISFHLPQVLTFLGVSAIQIGFSPSIAFYLIAVANANTAVGRLVSGALAVRFGAINIMVLFTLMAGVVTYIWPFVRSHTAFIVLTCLYGYVINLDLLNAVLISWLSGSLRAPLSVYFPLVSLS